MTERDLVHQARETLAIDRAVTSDPQVIVDHDDLLTCEAERDCALDERVLARGGLDVALKLPLRGLARIDERLAPQCDAVTFEPSLMSVSPRGAPPPPPAGTSRVLPSPSTGISSS